MQTAGGRTLPARGGYRGPMRGHLQRGQTDPGFLAKLEELGRCLQEKYGSIGDLCPACGEADLSPEGGKRVCPVCHYIAPCCDPC